MTTPIHNSSFPSVAWAAALVEELAGAGLTAVCLAPGSRSTPLTLAFHAHPAIQVYLHLDERSAAFFALGLAVASDKPVALVCTSGTAVANLMPAVVEAHMSQIPLLVLTSDRPHELRHSGANQTIDQVKFFADQVLWAVDAAVPEANASGVALRNLRTLAARAYATANGLVKGPVHLNLPFRKPLEPDAADQLPFASQLPASQPHTWMGNGRLASTAEQLQTIAQQVSAAPHGLIVCGPRCPGGDFASAVAALAGHTGYPILADPISGLRFGPWVANTPIISGYETFLQQPPSWPEPQLILRFGAVPTSRWLNEYLDAVQPRHRLHIRENGVWADDSHRTTCFLQVNESLFCQQLIPYLPPRPEADWATAVAQTDRCCWQATQPALEAEFFDATVVADVVELLPAGATLVMGNSLPIRHLDQFGRAQAKPLLAYANRGASGIDGNISTALGMAANSLAPLVLVVGDITFYHDMNGLLAVRQHNLNHVTIVLLNNDGGGIFNRLPVAKFEPSFTDLFITPHGLDFAPVAQLYGLHYVAAATRSAFRETFAKSLASSLPHIIEVKTNGRRDEQRRREIVALVKATLHPSANE